MNSASYTTRMLTHASEIRAAQHLLYRVYVEEMGWTPEFDNPSGLLVVEEQEQLLLTDDYDTVATWFGTFWQTELIACWRCIKPRNGLFEVELYQPIPENLKADRSMELARLAVHPDHRCRSIVLQQLACTTMAAIRGNCDQLLATAQFPAPGNLYLRLGAKLADLAAFKYSESDQNSVQLLYFDLNDSTTLVSRRLRPQVAAA